MTDETKLAQEQARGQDARALFEHPLIKEFLQKAKDETLSAWRNSGVDDTALREDAWRMLKAIERFEAMFRTTIADGQYAANRLLRDQEKT